jgi:hypothetical protein
MSGYRERFGFGDLRPGRVYVMHVKHRAERAEFTNEDALCAAIDEQLRRDADATIAVIQLSSSAETQHTGSEASGGAVVAAGP